MVVGPNEKVFGVNAKRAGHILSGIFLLLGALALDGKMCQLILENQKTSSYVATQANITKGRVDTTVTEVKGGQRITDTTRLAYTYEVNGQQYRGASESSVSTSASGGWAHPKRVEIPAGSTAEIYYDPVDPGTSVHTIGNSSAPFSMLLFSLPFQCLGPLIIWLALRSEPFPETGGIEIMNERQEILCSTVPVDRLSILLMTLVGTGFALDLALGFLYGRPIEWPAVGGWATLLVATSIVYLLVISRSRKPELVLNSTRNELSFAGRTLKFSDITGIEPRLSFLENYVLQLTGRDGENFSLFKWASKDQADVFAAWLKERIRSQA